MATIAQALGARAGRRSRRRAGAPRRRACRGRGFGCSSIRSSALADARRAGSRRSQRARRGADDVERAGDDDLPVGPASPRPRGRPRRRRRRPLDAIRRDPESRAAVGELVRVARACARRRAADDARRVGRAPSASSISAGSFSRSSPTTSVRSADGELVGQRARERLRARDVVRAVEHDERLVADDLESTRRAAPRRARRRPARPTAWRRRTPRPRRARSPRCRPGARRGATTNDLVVARPRREQVDAPGRRRRGRCG